MSDDPLIPVELRTPDALLGKNWNDIRRLARDGQSRAATLFMVQVEGWVNRRQHDGTALDAHGVPPGRRDDERRAQRLVDRQAEDHLAAVLKGEAETGVHLSSIATFAAEERAARINGEDESKRRHRQTMIAAWIAAATGIAGLVVGVAALLFA